jgi:cytochrome b-561 domain-containing protein 2
MQRNLTSAEKSRGLRLHRYAHGLGLCAATAGFSIIYCTKEIYNKPHLATWHGMIGLMGIIWMSVQAVMGNLLIFCPGLFGGPTQVRQYYRMHRVFGYGAVVTMWGATALGMMSNWMLRHLNYPWLGWTLGALALIGLLRRISLAAVRLR